MPSSRQGTIGTVFYHKNVQSQADLARISLCPIGERTPTSIPAKLRQHPIKVFFDNTSDHSGQVGRPTRKYVFFEIDPKSYPTPIPGKLFWVLAENEDALIQLFENIERLHPGVPASHYGIKLGSFLRRIIWNRGEMADDARENVMVTRLLVSVSGQEGQSNISNILFSSREERGLMQRGLLAMIHEMITLRVQEMVILCKDSKRGLKVLVDGGGRFRVGMFSRLGHAIPFVRVVSEICSQGLLMEVDRPAKWEEFYIPEP